MAYQIFTGHRLETLVEDHRDRFRSPFLGPRPLIVLQNQSLAQWLKLFLARTVGGYVTGDFVFQDELLRRLIATAPGDPGRILFLDDLKFALYRHLAQALGPDADPVYRPLHPRGGRPDPQRLFELADHIAGVFHNYAMNSRLWPPALASGHLPEGTGADPEAFAWQSLLWRELLTGDRGSLAGLVLDRLTATPPAPQGPAPEVILVGSAFLSRRAAAFLRAWADAGLVEVTHLLLLPSPAETWPDERPWSSWGAFGRAFLDALPTRRAPASAPAAPGPTPAPDPAGPTALKRLQGALLAGLPFPGAPADPSLEIVCAPHPLRELEVLRDRILGALAGDPSLEVHEIAVLAPDINLYAPFLETAFASDDPGRHLRHHVIDLDLGRENAWLRALDALLSLVSGTLDRPTLFALVDAEAFGQAWALEGDERELWLDYTQEISAWREDPTEAGGPQSWTAGADRLWAGWFRTDELPGAAPPLDAPPSAFRDLGRFQRLLETLGDRNRQTRRPRSFADWITFLDQIVVEFLGPGDGTGSVLSSRLRALVADAGAPEEALPWAGFRAFVQDQIAHFPGRRGQLLTEGIHCSSLRPLRAIPFRFIAVLGLDEGRFPRGGAGPAFDLTRHEPGQDAVGPAALDRYCFWETLMAAQDRLHLSWIGRSPVDGGERPPSTVLADLMDFLETKDAGGQDRPWPVTTASIKDFSVLAGDPPTASPRTWRRARAAGAPSAPWAPSPLPGPRPGDEAQPLAEVFPEVRPAEVLQAFTAPARFHLRRVRQVVLRDEDRRSTDEEEPWSLAFLDREAWLREGLRLHLGGHRDRAWDVAGLVDRAVATGLVRPGVFSDRDRHELEGQAGRARAWADELLAEGWQGPEAAPDRGRWAGRPWAPEAGDRLVRGREVLFPRMLYGEALPARTRIEAGLGQLQTPAPQAWLATLSPLGVRARLLWGPDPAATRDLAAQAEAFWLEAVRRPLAFYPDFVEAVAKARKARPDEAWSLTVEGAWRQCREKTFSKSEGTLGRDPYAGLVWPDDPDWNQLAQDGRLWWDSFFRPLWEAWT